MLPELKEFFDNSAAREISLVSFMRRFPDIQEKSRIVRTWTGALCYLQQHSSLEKRQLYQSLRKFTQSELEKLIDKELQEREHDNALLAHASRQELAALRMHTRQVEERFDAEKPALTSGATPTATSSTTSTATGSVQSTEQLTDKALGDYESGVDLVLDPLIARARASPLYELVKFIFKKTQGQDPQLPALPPGLSLTHNEMFRLALDILSSPGDITKKKPVFSLVSGIINTLSPIGQQFTLSPLVEEQSRMECLSYTSTTVDGLRAELQAALYPDPDDPAAMSIESLQKFVYGSLLQCVGPRLARASKEKYLILKIVSQVLHWLENDIFTAPLSEHVFVSAWSDILNTLFAQSGLLGIPIFVDKSWADEICVFECKPEVSDQVCQMQQGKSVRLNTATLLNLEEKGLDIKQWHPIVAETRALSVDFYTLRRYDDVIGAGRATHEKVWLPSGYTKLDAFLSSRSFEVLLGFR
ncbi:hypothetical protein EC991_008861, partial [Linnemannia zychae]